jgi:predicted nucleic acid-binding protein
MEDFRDFQLDRYPHEPFLQRIWQLRHNFTAYDAAHVALAEALDATLLTRNAVLASPAAHYASIVLLQPK